MNAEKNERQNQEWECRKRVCKNKKPRVQKSTIGKTENTETIQEVKTAIAREQENKPREQ